MYRLSLLVVCAVSFVGCGRPGGPPAPPAAPIAASSSEVLQPPMWGKDDWPMWRGAFVDGIASGKPVPVSWKDGEAKENIVWKKPVPGRGHSSPIVIGEHIYMETADEAAQVQSVLCLDRDVGNVVWKTDLFQKNFESAMHGENTQASNTLACDGERLFASFLNDRKIWLVALDLRGKEIWKTEIGGFTSKFGYSASPILHHSFVIIAADHQTGGFLAAVHRQSGKIIWRIPRPSESSYASPRVVSVGGKDVLVICGCELVAGYDPLTGEELWSTKGTTSAAVGTMVTTGDLIFASGGYPGRDTVALKPNGDVVWRTNEKSYVPSLLAYQGFLYMVNDDGIAYCYEAETGKERWKQRIGGNFRTSPILNGGHIFTTDMRGKTTVFKANPNKFEKVAENQTGTESFASPAISRGQLFLRVADNSQGPKQDWIYCIGKE